MAAYIIDGKACAKVIQAQLTKAIAQRIQQGLRSPSLAVIQVGTDPASEIYVRHKHRACQSVGIESSNYTLPASIPENNLLNQITVLNQDPLLDGILVQLPLPDHINTQTVVETISPHKDVDGFHPYNLGLLAQGKPLLRPATPYGIMRLLKTLPLRLAGLHAVVIGASNIVGKPMALELLQAACTVTICHRQTRYLAQHVQEADLLISAIGKPHIVQSDWLKEGVIIIDVGIHRLPSGKIVGDIEWSTAYPCAGAITPVPGGVGPMTVAMLLENTFIASSRLNAKSR